MIKINGREYAWGDIVIWMFGQPIIGIRAIEYGKTKEKTHLHAAGRNAKSIQHGKRICEGSITLLQSEVAALNRSAKAKGYKDILDVDVESIVVTYTSDNAVVTVDRIIGVSFSEIPKSMGVDDAHMEVAMPFLALDIEEEI